MLMKDLRKEGRIGEVPSKGQCLDYMIAINSKGQEHDCEIMSAEDE